jgi:hypothetical protein
MILYLKDPIKLHPKLLNSINTFSNVAGYKIYKNQYPPTMNKLIKEYRKKFHVR